MDPNLKARLQEAIRQEKLCRAALSEARISGQDSTIIRYWERVSQKASDVTDTIILQIERAG